MRILQISDPKNLREIMQELKVDEYGINIMLPKAIQHLVRINSLPCITANILKQEMLSLGGDVAVARGALTGKTKTTDCLLMATLSQFNRLSEKLKEQPFGLDKLADELSHNISNYQRNEFILDLGRHKLRLGRGRTYIMGILNLTPDSFSGDGLYQGLSPLTTDRDGSRQRNNETINREPSLNMAVGTLPDRVVDFVERMVADDADIIDIGAESSRPGAKAVSLKEELKRIIPVIKKIAKRIKVPISIDTSKPEVARQALDYGVAIVNDITGLRNSKMVDVVAKYKAGVVIMHMKGNPASMQNEPTYKSLLDEIIDYLAQAISRAVEGGIDKEKIILDPGIGFGKTLEHNLEILKRLGELKILGRPILVGPSRKSFLGKILNVVPKARIFGTVSSCVLASQNGAHIVRVHDIRAVKQALKIADSINNI